MAGFVIYIEWGMPGPVFMVILAGALVKSV